MGKDKETLALTYKAISRPIANYAAPIFAPQLPPTNWSLIQRAQNAALRTVTGCHSIANEDHLHSETNILPIKPHTHIIAMQYSYKCRQQQHPNHDLTHIVDPPRCKRKTLVTKYRDCLNTLPPPTNRRKLRSGINYIHTHTVRQTIEHYTNRVLRTRSPQINRSEETLPRTTKTTSSINKRVQTTCYYAINRNDFNPDLVTHLHSFYAKL